VIDHIFLLFHVLQGRRPEPPDFERDSKCCWLTKPYTEVGKTLPVFSTEVDFLRIGRAKFSFKALYQPREEKPNLSHRIVIVIVNFWIKAVSLYIQIIYITNLVYLVMVMKFDV